MGYDINKLSSVEAIQIPTNFKKVDSEKYFISEEEYDDFIRFMNWEKNNSPQMTLFDDLNPSENELIAILREGKQHIDFLKHKFSEKGDLSILLLQLEMKGIIKSRPGNYFEL